MLSSEFENHLTCFPQIQKRFQGIYSSDNLPKQIKKNSFIICNTDTSKGYGKHWYCIIKFEPSVLECFDSLGIDEVKKKFLSDHFHLRHVSKIKFNVSQVQSSSSSTCGKFVLFFLINRFHNKDLNFSDLLNEIFTNSQSENEQKVESFFKQHFHHE